MWKWVGLDPGFCLSGNLFKLGESFWLSKDCTCKAGDLDSIPGLRRSPWEVHGNPLQYSCMEHSVDRGVLAGYSPWFAKNQIQLSNYHFFFFLEKLSKIVNMKLDKRPWKGLIKWRCKNLSPIVFLYSLKPRNLLMR